MRYSDSVYLARYLTKKIKKLVFMSKGNMLLGYARGKVGSMVFSRLNGEQIVKSYNSSPRNDRTDAQMIQRSLFLAANKLFTRGQQNFFEFAFEDRGRSESDFNAFMRNNIKRGIMMSRAGFEEQSYPSVGPWLMTKGSLPGVNISAQTDSNKYNIATNTDSGASSVGDFCQTLRSHFGVQNGDIITLCVITALGSDSTNTPDVHPQPRQYVNWIIKQIICDTNDTSELHAAFDGYITTSSLHPSTHYIVDAQVSSECVTGACIVVSRKTRRGLKVSTTELVMNDEAATAYNTGQSDTYRQEVLDSWQSKPESVLEGSEVEETTTGPVFKGFKGAAASAEGTESIQTTGVGETLAQTVSNLQRYVKIEMDRPSQFNPSLLSIVGSPHQYFKYNSRTKCLMYTDNESAHSESRSIYYDGNLLFIDPPYEP